jgi:hypothetical protein
MNGELNFRLSLLIAKFFGKSSKEQMEIHKFIKDMYSWRCQLSHGNTSSKDKRTDEQKGKDLKRLEEFARKTVKSYFENPVLFEHKIKTLPFI